MDENEGIDINGIPSDYPEAKAWWYEVIKEAKQLTVNVFGRLWHRRFRVLENSHHAEAVIRLAFERIAELEKENEQHERTGLKLLQRINAIECHGETP